MAIDTQKRIGRRALLAAGAASLVAVAAEAVTAPAEVAAADHDALKIGETNTGTTTTTLSSTAYPTFRATTTFGDALVGSNSGGGSGVYGESSNASGYGVYGQNTISGNTGYIGGPDFAVHGECGGPQLAIQGTANAASGVGVYGWNDANKTLGLLGGVYGVIAGATTDHGLALGVYGKAAFSRSGILTIPANRNSVTHSGIALSDGCLVLAALQQYRSGVYVAAAVPDIAADSFRIYLNKKVPAATKVAWFVINRVLPD